MCDKLKAALSKIPTEGKNMTKQEQMKVFQAISEDMTDHSNEMNKKMNNLEKKFDTINIQNTEILKIVNQNTTSITRLETKLDDNQIEEKAFAYEEFKAEKRNNRQALKENKIYLIGGIILIGLGVAFILEHTGALTSLINTFKG